MTLQPDPHPRLLVWCCSQTHLNLSHVINIIINIINITLGSSVAPKPKALGHIVVERPNTLRS